MHDIAPTNLYYTLLFDSLVSSTDCGMVRIQSMKWMTLWNLCMPNQRNEANLIATFYSRLLLNSLERHRRATHWNWNRSVAKGKSKPNESRSAHRPVRRVHANHNALAWQPNNMLAFGPKIQDIEVSPLSQCAALTADPTDFVSSNCLGSSTLPRATTRSAETETGGRSDKVTAATSSTSLYDNVPGGNQGKTDTDFTAIN